MSQQNTLEILADVLVKAAEYIEELENELEAGRPAAKKMASARIDKEAREIAKVLQPAVGHEVDIKVAKKIASVEDKDVKSIIKKLATSQDASRLGKVRRKTSGVSRLGRDDADQGFATWILS